MDNDETIVHISRLKLRELEEKAQKWDEMQVKFTEWNHSIDEYIDKAKKYDEIIHRTMFTTIEEYKEQYMKAKKWDSLWDKMEQVSYTMSVEDIKIWRDKAKKWDERENYLFDNVTVTPEYFKELEYKSKRYDRLTSKLADLSREF